MKEKQIKKIKDLLNKEKDVFEEEEMKKVSKAGFGRLQWVKATTRYYEVAKTVGPERKLVRELQQKKELAEINLAKINKELKELAVALEKLTEDEKEQSAKLKELKEEAEMMTRRLNAASQLIEGLGSERTRWSADLEMQASVKKRLVGDCLLCAAFVSYAGPFNFVFRLQMAYQNWKKLCMDQRSPMTQDFKLQTLLTSDVEVSTWSGFGLPSDELSVQNGILVCRTQRFPLCVDPQMQAVSWIKKKEEKQGLTVKSFNDDDAKFLELAIQYGKPFLFENLDEELDPMAVVQDRRKFGRIGWNVAYDFNGSDLKVSFRLPNMYFQKASDMGELIPWETPRYLIGEAMYGGRVVDNFDRRVISTYMEEYMGDFLFDENVPFFFSRSGFEYTCPAEGNVALYQGHIMTLPINQSPAVFQLHANAEMQTGSGSDGGGISKEDYIGKTAGEVQKKIPDEELKFHRDGVPTPAEVVLIQEIERFEFLSGKMYATLVDLKRALKGEIGMSMTLSLPAWAWMI
jgi:hypothetical protein